MFRPEMLEPMGLPADVRVHGWGLSLERPTMIRLVLAFRSCQILHSAADHINLCLRRYGISNIRDLLGHKVPLEMIEKSAAVRF